MRKLHRELYCVCHNHHTHSKPPLTLDSGTPSPSAGSDPTCRLHFDLPSEPVAPDEPRLTNGQPNSLRHLLCGIVFLIVLAIIVMAFLSYLVPGSEELRKTKFALAILAAILFRYRTKVSRRPCYGQRAITYPAPRKRSNLCRPVAKLSWSLSKKLDTQADIFLG